MTLYRLELRYDGAPFTGWQSQPDGNAVQDHLEKALATFLRHPVRVTGAARTDSGVHAEHQVATFRTEAPFDARRWLASLHGLLPETIGVASVAAVADDFHPILSAKGKAYRYRLWRGPSRDPFVARYAWALHGGFDVAAMAAEAKSFVGTHDFTSFCAVDSSAKTKTRTVHEVTLDDRGALVDVWVLGDGFLKQMVRTMVGTLVDVGTGRSAPGSVAKMIEARDRRAAGRAAPAEGLALVKVFYEEPQPAAVLMRAAAGGLSFALVPGLH